MDITIPYTTPDGSPGMHVIPHEVIAVRMALLGITDPEQALAIVLQEFVCEDPNPYGELLSRVRDQQDPTPGQESALAALAPVVGPDTQDLAGAKDLVSGQLREEIFQRAVGASAEMWADDPAD